MSSFGQHPPAEHVVVQISDTHLLAGNAKLYGSIDSDAPLMLLMERLVASGITIDALVFTGDLADRGEEGINLLTEYLGMFLSKICSLQQTVYGRLQTAPKIFGYLFSSLFVANGKQERCQKKAKKKEGEG